MQNILNYTTNIQLLFKLVAVFHYIMSVYTFIYMCAVLLPFLYVYFIFSHCGLKIYKRLFVDYLTYDTLRDTVSTRVGQIGLSPRVGGWV